MLKTNDFCQNWLARHNSNAIAIFPNECMECGIVRSGSVLSVYHSQERGFILTWILEGTGTFHSQGEHYELHPNCLCLRRPGREYHLEFSARTEHHRCFLHLPTSLYDFLISMHPRINSLPPVIEAPYMPSLHQRFLQLLDDYVACTAGNLHWLLPETFSWILDITSLSMPAELKKLALSRSMLEKTQENLSLEAIAAACQMNYDRFRKAFQKTYGVSPGQYRINYRILVAKRLLLEGMSVGSVASTLNYPDIYSFSHQFRSVAGCSPSDYVRRKNGLSQAR